MIDLSQVKNYYVAAGFTDLRRGIDGLAAIVTQQFGHELSEDSLFMFCGRRTDRIKALYYSGDGYVLIYKRLTNGSFQWPRTETELRLLDARSFRWLMEMCIRDRLTPHRLVFQAENLYYTVMRAKIEAGARRPKREAGVCR